MRSCTDWGVAWWRSPDLRGQANPFTKSQTGILFPRCGPPLWCTVRGVAAPTPRATDRDPRSTPPRRGYRSAREPTHAAATPRGPIPRGPIPRGPIPRGPIPQGSASSNTTSVKDQLIHDRQASPGTGHLSGALALLGRLLGGQGAGSAGSPPAGRAAAPSSAPRASLDSSRVAQARRVMNDAHTDLDPSGPSRTPQS